MAIHLSIFIQPHLQIFVPNRDWDRDYPNIQWHWHVQDWAQVLDASQNADLWVIVGDQAFFQSWIQSYVAESFDRHQPMAWVSKNFGRALKKFIKYAELWCLKTLEDRIHPYSLMRVSSTMQPQALYGHRFQAGLWYALAEQWGHLGDFRHLLKHIKSLARWAKTARQSHAIEVNGQKYEHLWVKAAERELLYWPSTPLPLKASIKTLLSRKFSKIPELFLESKEGFVLDGQLYPTAEAQSIILRPGPTLSKLDIS